MGYFDKIRFELTMDGSVGLYDEKADEILHSRTGALNEANEKFIYPFIPFLSHFSDCINILDICYGIGYNTKAAFNALSNHCLKIDALELNKNLALLSPFVDDGINDDELKLFILSEIYNSTDNKEEPANIIDTLTDKSYDRFISSFTKKLIADFQSQYNIINPDEVENTSLHNIYYQYISERMKTLSKSNKYKDSFLNLYFGDARKTIFTLNNVYDIVFLDAYSPQKNPILWTIDFLSVVKLKMKTNSVLVSYSKSSPFRSALLELGFFVGKTLVDGKDMGTIASLNSIFIQNKLNQEDIEILRTRSGIPYRDINLNLSSNDIIINRSIEGAASPRISRTQFQKSL